MKDFVTNLIGLFALCCLIACCLLWLLPFWHGFLAGLAVNLATKHIKVNAE